MSEEEKYRGLDSAANSSGNRKSSQHTRTQLHADPEKEEQDDRFIQSRKLMLNLWDRYGREY